MLKNDCIIFKRRMQLKAVDARATVLEILEQQCSKCSSSSARNARAAVLEILEQQLRGVRKKASAFPLYEKAVHTGREDRLARSKYGGSLLRKKPI